MFRFSIRDLLWLTLVAALVLGWFIRERELQHSVHLWRGRACTLEEAVNRQLELKVDWLDSQTVLLIQPRRLPESYREKVNSPGLRRDATQER